MVGVVGERGGQELESSSLCLRVAVAGGARWAKMTEWVVSLPSSCSLLDGITCKLSTVVNVSISLRSSERGCLYGSTRPLP